MAKSGPRRARLPQPRIAVVLIGMHRSGGGALAQALHLLGCALPASPAAAPGSAPNVSPPQIVALNDHVLEEMGSRWDAPRIMTVRGHDPSSSSDLQLHLQDRFAVQAAQAIAEDFPGAPDAPATIVVNDPRIGLFPLLWDAAFRRAGYEPRYVAVFRNPQEVVQSIRASHTLPPPRIQQLWLRYSLAALDRPHGLQPLAVVAYDAMLADGAAVLRRLARAIGLPSPLAANLRGGLPAVLDGGLRHYTVGDDAVLQSGITAALVKTVLGLLRGWHDLPDAQRASQAAAAAAAYQEFALLAGIVVTLPPPAPRALHAIPAAGRARATPAVRNLILHYHLFKNAGTSVDAVLQKAFGDRWVAQEYPTGRHAEQQQELAELLAGRPDAVAVSSHTLVLPLPVLQGVQVHPILFVRHPIDRLRSAYTFERRQDADTLGARLARAHDFAGYLQARLRMPHDRTCRNFQAHRLAMAWPGPPVTQAARALRVLDQLPFVGLVDAFAESMVRLEAWLAPIFPGFSGFAVRHNAQAPASALADRLAAIRAELGGDMYDAVTEANQADMAVYETVCGRYAIDAAA